MTRRGGNRPRPVADADRGRGGGEILVRGNGKLEDEGRKRRETRRDLAFQHQRPAGNLQPLEAVQVAHAQKAVLHLAAVHDRRNARIRNVPPARPSSRRTGAVCTIPLAVKACPEKISPSVDPRAFGIGPGQHQVRRAGIHHEADRRAVDIERQVVMPVRARGTSTRAPSIITDWRGVTVWRMSVQRPTATMAPRKMKPQIAAYCTTLPRFRAGHEEPAADHRASSTR
jgi:hypothetical protein